MNKPAPSLFLTHGAPLWLSDPIKKEALGRWGQALGQPQAVLVFSGHWESDQLTLGETCRHQRLIYDFYGFPPECYQAQYPAPGAPELAKRVEEILGRPLPQVERGLDHGVWVPLVHLWPQANVPILQLSLPRQASPEALFELGQSLTPLRQEGVILVGSGSATHNLGLLQWQGGEPSPSTQAFDQWLAQVLLTKDKTALLQWEKSAPDARLHHPTLEHFTPLLIAAGAGWQEQITFPLVGFDYANLSIRMAQFGA